MRASDGRRVARNVNGRPRTSFSAVYDDDDDGTYASAATETACGVTCKPSERVNGARGVVGRGPAVTANRLYGARRLSFYRRCFDDIAWVKRQTQNNRRRPFRSFYFVSVKKGKGKKIKSLGPVATPVSTSIVAAIVVNRRRPVGRARARAMVRPR